MIMIVPSYLANPQVSREQRGTIKGRTRKERFFGKKWKKIKEIRDKAISITTVKATKFGMTLFNGTYI